MKHLLWCPPDVRPKQDYDESHVITARRVKKKAGDYVLPESVDLTCVRYCVVYDSNTLTLETTLKPHDENYEDLESDDNELGGGAAVECGRVMSQHTRQPVLILRGGYELFSATYHFFRTQKIIWMPQELDAFKPYPFAIMEGQIYLGNFAQACDPKIKKDLKINAHVNISTESTPFFEGSPDQLLHIQVRDSEDCHLFPFFRLLCHFIEIHLELRSVVLIFSTLGINRSCAAAVAFLMHHYSQSLKRSCAFVRNCQNSMILSRGLVVQLSHWEKIVLGDVITDIREPFH